MQTTHSQCDDVPPPLVLKGLREFNAGEYFECHETLETAWRAEPGPVRDLYRAVLQVGLGYYQIGRGNYTGARKMFLRAERWFANLPDSCQGIDVARLRADAAAARAHLEALGPARITQFDRSLLKPVHYENPLS
jgi:predicted metal-dependent hydrolase